jgi:geranylgeranyl pyrophosphate synthase
LFDYTDEAIGKPTGIDIKEQKMTLPLIHFEYLYRKRKIVVDQLYYKTTIKIKKESKKYCICQRQQRSTLRRDKNG